MAKEDPIPPSVRAEAAHWLAQQDAGSLSPTQERLFQDWLKSAAVNRRAFSNAQRVWNALDANLLRGGEIAPDPYPRKVRHRQFWRRFAGAAVAACLVAMILVETDIPMRLRADAITAPGEQRLVTLADGSTILLNTDSAIAIEAPTGRTLRLLRGEAAFRVAPDRRNPFSVETGEGTTTALGTRFIIRKEGDETDVTVTEHAVRVATDTEATVIGEGQTVAYRKSNIGPSHRVAITEADAWTRGKIRVVNKPLGDVVKELARYHRGYFGVWNSTLAQRPVSGVFDIDDPVKALTTIQQTLGIASTRLTDRVIILHL